MKRKELNIMKTLWIFLAIVLFPSQSAFSNDNPLQIRVSFKPDSYKEEIKRSKGYFRAAISIQNVSGTDQTILVYSCDGRVIWKSDRSEIRVEGMAKGFPKSCTRNIDIPMVLKPNEEYLGKVQIAVSNKAKTGPFVFRLGVYLNKRLAIDGSAEQIAWSDEISIIIEPWMVPLLTGDQPFGGIFDVKDVKLEELSPEVKKLMIQSGAQNILPPCPDGTYLDGQHCKMR